MYYEYVFIFTNQNFNNLKNHIQGKRVPVLVSLCTRAWKGFCTSSTTNSSSWDCRVFYP